jgi:phosphatidylglycerol---prolipoprotein diacylglyceryl transferase
MQAVTEALGIGIPFPDWIRPDVFTIPGFTINGATFGPFPLRWYALAYIGGIGFCWWYMVQMLKTKRLWADPPGPGLNARDVEDFIFYAALGVILGGRIGSVLFYNSDKYLNDPIQILYIWEGGMSFHGGLIGVIIAMVLFARSRKIPLLRLGDIVSVGVPVGLGLGRLANFVNQELWGRPTELPWGMVFKTDPLGLSRHPSQLYQAAFEGIVLFVVLRILSHRFQAFSRPGLLAGVLLAGYGIGRILLEFVREPDANLSDLPFGLTMGMILSAPMLIGGAYLILRALRRTQETPQVV